MSILRKKRFWSAVFGGFLVQLTYIFIHAAYVFSEKPYSALAANLIEAIDLTYTSFGLFFLGLLLLIFWVITKANNLKEYGLGILVSPFIYLAILMAIKILYNSVLS